MVRNNITNTRNYFAPLYVSSSSSDQEVPLRVNETEVIDLTGDDDITPPLAPLVRANTQRFPSPTPTLVLPSSPMSSSSRKRSRSQDDDDEGSDVESVDNDEVSRLINKSIFINKKLALMTDTEKSIHYDRIMKGAILQQASGQLWQSFFNFSMSAKDQDALMELIYDAIFHIQN